MKRYYIKISGAAWNIEGNTPKEAIDSIRKFCDCYVGFNALEIGVDCDELGYEIRTVVAKDDKTS